ncbi:unnamed protein product [Mytilus edulis]|uniref:Uncharacterized protein n=1 Tax=Mytilus edulis TaxID=6550 RepID=A0A8S3QB85_MYTED|nr:unnamed protein product [Mytilus edulis]
MILQELCRLRLDWDDPIPPKLESLFSLWFQDLHELSDFKVDRCFRPEKNGEIKNAQLHHFSDASESGYGTVTYLRLENTFDEIHCSFVMGKARVTPLKTITVPRLELTAATVAVRTNKMLLNELEIPIDRSIFWTDCMSVLRYILNEDARFQTFVTNRLAVIHEGSFTDNWRYVNTKLNPADHASRGLTSSEMKKNVIGSLHLTFYGKMKTVGRSHLQKIMEQYVQTTLKLNKQLCEQSLKLKLRITILWESRNSLRISHLGCR